MPLDETDKIKARAAKFGLPVEGEKSEKAAKIAARAEVRHVCSQRDLLYVKKRPTSANKSHSCSAALGEGKPGMRVHGTMAEHVY